MMRVDLLERPIAFHAVFIKLGVGVTGALMLSQALYWSRRTKDPEGWFYKTVTEWREETYMTRHEIDGARARLREIGVFEEQKKGVPCKVHYRVKIEVLEALLTGGQTSFQFAENRQIKSPKSSNLVRHEPAGHPAGNRQTITETIHKTTAETTSDTAGSSRRSRNDEPPGFAEAWAAYPKRAGDNPRQKAAAAYRARLTEGETPQALLDGTLRYAAFCQATGKAGTEYVKQGSTFYGPQKGYQADWTPPATPRLPPTTGLRKAAPAAAGFTSPEDFLSDDKGE